MIHIARRCISFLTFGGTSKQCLLRTIRIRRYRQVQFSMLAVQCFQFAPVVAVWKAAYQLLDFLIYSSFSLKPPIRFVFPGERCRCASLRMNSLVSTVTSTEWLLFFVHSDCSSKFDCSADGLDLECAPLILCCSF